MKKRNFLTLGLSAALALSSVPVTSSAYLIGDVNGDGLIDARDASLVLQAYSVLSTGGTPDINFGAADVNGDGLVNASDASAILKEYAISATGGVSKTVCLSSDYEPSGNAEAADLDGEFITSRTAFGLELLKRQLDGKSACISPYSVTDALAMTANGAGGDTLAEMESALGMDIESLNSHLLGRRELLGDNFRSADSIWFRDGGTYVEPEFLQKNADYFGADIFKSPFDYSTANDINKWVRERTGGLVPQLLDSTPKGNVCLLNAAVFEADWEEQVPDISVKSMPFTAADGTVRDVDMMLTEESCYLGNDRASGIYKYYSGRRFAFAAIIPDDDISIDEYIRTLSGEELAALLAERATYCVQTRMPMFDIDYSVTLNDTLKDMGMIAPFTSNADFSRMGGTDEGSLFIGGVEHKTHIEVNQLGTRAAAATEIYMPCTSYPYPPEMYREVNFDRPFLWCIVDTETNIPLFIGTVEEV